MKVWLYSIVRAIAQALVMLLFPLRVSGREHVPTQGPVILCANHIANLDPLLLGSAISSRHVHFMAKVEIFRFKPLAAIFRSLGVIPVRRGEADMSALRASMQALRDGHALGMFAQGHRDKTGELAMESGVALIALRTKAPVIPVFLVGPYRPFRRFRFEIGPAVDLSAFSGKYDSTLLKGATEAIEQAVRALKPCAPSA